VEETSIKYKLEVSNLPAGARVDNLSPKVELIRGSRKTQKNQKKTKNSQTLKLSIRTNSKTTKLALHCPLPNWLIRHKRITKTLTKFSILFKGVRFTPNHPKGKENLLSLWVNRQSKTNGRKRFKQPKKQNMYMQEKRVKNKVEIA